MILHDCAILTCFASIDMKHGLEIGKGRSCDQFLLFGKVDFMTASHNYIQPRYGQKGVQSPSDHSCEAMSHVVPDLVQKILKGQKPFPSCQAQSQRNEETELKVDCLTRLYRVIEKLTNCALHRE